MLPPLLQSRQDGVHGWLGRPATHPMQYQSWITFVNIHLSPHPKSELFMLLGTIVCLAGCCHLLAGLYVSDCFATFSRTYLQAQELALQTLAAGGCCLQLWAAVLEVADSLLATETGRH